MSFAGNPTGAVPLGQRWLGVSLERTMPSSSGASIGGNGLFVTSRTKAHYKYQQEERGE